MTFPVRLRADLAILLTSLIWGATFVVVKDALRDCSTLLFLAIRFGIATLALGVVFHRKLQLPMDRRLMVRAALITGCFLFLGYGFQTAGLRFTTASKSAFITGLYIVLVPFFASIVNKTVPRPAEIGAIAMAGAGTVLMTSPGLDMTWNVGDGLTVLCAFAYAAHILSVERFTRKISFELLSVLQIGVVALLSLGTFGWLETPRLVWTPRLLFAFAITAILATALSFALYTWAQRQTTATRAAVLFSTEPIFAGLTAWLIAGEAWNLRSLGGAALILGGILAVELKPARYPQHPSQ